MLQVKGFISAVSFTLPRPHLTKCFLIPLLLRKQCYALDLSTQFKLITYYSLPPCVGQQGVLCVLKFYKPGFSF